jgi:type II secretory pathway pseudopilin PulG
LVVIAIIGVLVALLLPAIQAARESARRSQCANRLKQMGLAAVNHEAAQKFLPTGGWGWGWAGDPDKGYGVKQPGGWYYNSLTYLEQDALRRLGSDGNPAVVTPDQRTQGARRIATPLSEYVCPSRPGMPTKLYTHGTAFKNISLVAGVSQVGRNDYAASGGDRPPHDSPTATWRTGGGNYTQFGPDAVNTVTVNLTVYTRSFQLLHEFGNLTAANGVVGVTSELRLSEIEDGTSSTIWVGEKYIPATKYDAGAGSDNNGNDQGWDCGYDVDNIRWTMDPPKVDEWIDPSGGLTSQRSTQVFGSAHTTGCQFVYVDGSVHTISYDVDPVAFHQLGNRSDGEAGLAATP